MSRVVLLLSTIICLTILLLASNCSQAHVKSMEENNVGVEYYQKKLYPQAIEHLTRSVTLDDSNEQAHFHLAQVYIAMSDWEEAARHLQRSIVLNNGVADYHYKLGFVLIQLEQYERAEGALKQAIEMDATLYKAYFRLAQVYVAFDRAEDALRQYTESINRNPRFIEAYRELGTLYADLNFLPQAEQVFQSALEAVTPGNAEEAEIRHRLGTVFQEKQEYAQAITQFRRAWEIDSTQSDTLFCLGWTYALMNEKENARLYLKKFVNAAGGDERIRQDFVKAARDKLYEFGEDPMR